MLREIPATVVVTNSAPYFVIGLTNAHIFDVPVTHLLQETPFVILVGGPTHVKDIWCFLPSDHVFHERFPTVVVESTRKIFSQRRVSLKHLNFESLGAGLFRQKICSYTVRDKK